MTRRLPAFLNKLYLLCQQLSPAIGAFDENGQIFIVTDSTKFQESLRQYFAGSLQTFIRQLHFYGFSKHDVPNSNHWTFSHEHFKKDRPDLLYNIYRRKQTTAGSNKGGRDEDDEEEEEEERSTSTMSSAVDSEARALVKALQKQIEDLRKEVNSLRDLSAAKSLLAFDEVGGLSTKRLKSFGSNPFTTSNAPHSPSSSSVHSGFNPATMQSSSSSFMPTSLMNHFNANRVLLQAPILSRNVSLELNSNFDDNSSVTSNSTMDLVKELQTSLADDAFYDMERNSPNFSSMNTTDGNLEKARLSASGCEKQKLMLAIKATLQESDLVTKKVFDFILKQCGPKGENCGGVASEDLKERKEEGKSELDEIVKKLKAMVETRPDPKTLAPPAKDPLCVALTPYIRKDQQIADDVPDSQIAQGVRCCYEMFHKHLSMIGKKA